MAQILTGAKAVIKVDSLPLLWCSSITIEHELLLEEIPQLDELEVAEYAENGHRCRFTINHFKANDSAIAALGLDPQNLKDVIAAPELIVEVVDSITNLPVYQMFGVKFEGGSGQVDARGVWTGTWRFRAKRGKGI